jgi:hypothetical protein
VSFDLGFEPTWHKCRTCDNEHALVDAVCWDCTQRVKAERDRHRRIDESLATIPDGMQWATLDAPELAQRVANGHEMLLLARRSLRSVRNLFVGHAGKGKTSLACAMFRAFIETTERRAVFVPSVRLSGGRFELDESFLTAALVLIDDVGMERQQANNMLPELVYERHAAGLATWATTGLTSPQLTDRYGDGIVRRLCEQATIFKVGKGKQ